MNATPDPKPKPKRRTAKPEAETAEPEAASATRTDPREAVVEALMSLAAVQPWNDIEIGDIAREAGISLAAFRELFPSKGAVLGGLSRIIDRKVLADDGADLADEPARERLFDVLMRRLDAMEPYRPALRRIAYALRGDLPSLIALNGVALNSHRFMLASAGIDSEGALGRVKLQGCVIAFSRTVEVWLDDDDPALARTMAKLDRELRRGETLLERADDVRRLTAPLRAFGRALGEIRPRRKDKGEKQDDSGDGDSTIAV